MAKLGIGIYSGNYSQKREVELPEGKEKELEEIDRYYQNGIKLSQMKLMIAGNNAEFKGTKMQDAFEYYQHFMLYLQKGEK